MGYAAVVLFAGFILAMFLGASSYGPLRVTGLAILGCYFIGAVYLGYRISVERDDPRNVAHIDSGKTVLASADFDAESDSNRGKVDLGGEIRDAVCEGEQLPCKGDKLLVVRRDGGTLVVSPRDASNARSAKDRY